jgi:hypothetical protein
LAKARTAPELILGGNYYVCFGSNYAYPCMIKEIINEFSETEVRIEIPMKPQSKKGFRDQSGNISHRWTQSNILYVTELVKHQKKR